MADNPLTAATRTVAGRTLPAAGTWDIDPGHAEVAFIGRHLMLTKVRGRFPGVTGAVVVADEPEASSVEVTIEMASVGSGNSTRDDHLRSADFFEVEVHPTARYRSTSLAWDGTAGTVTGELSVAP